MHRPNSYKETYAVNFNRQRLGINISSNQLNAGDYFRASLKKGLSFREAVRILEQTLLYCTARPKSKISYQKFNQLKKLELIEELIKQEVNGGDQLSKISEDIDQIKSQLHQQKTDYQRAISKYQQYHYEQNMGYSLIPPYELSVNNTQLSMEAFSTNACCLTTFSTKSDTLRDIENNRSFSIQLPFEKRYFEQLNQIRNYQTTQINIEAKEDSIIKVAHDPKWDQVKTLMYWAMASHNCRFQLQPIDIHNICTLIQQKSKGAKRINCQVQLNKNQPVQLHFPEWPYTYKCVRTNYIGSQKGFISIYDIRPITLLRPILPWVPKVNVHLLNNDLPVFFSAPMNDLHFCLGLCGNPQHIEQLHHSFEMNNRETQEDIALQEEFLGVLASKTQMSEKEIGAHFGLTKQDKYKLIINLIMKRKIKCNLSNQKYQLT